MLYFTREAVYATSSYKSSVLARQRNSAYPLNWQKYLVWLYCKPAYLKISPAEKGAGSASKQFTGAIGKLQKDEWTAGSTVGDGSLAGREGHILCVCVQAACMLLQWLGYTPENILPMVFKVYHYTVVLDTLKGFLSFKNRISVVGTCLQSV